VSAVHERLLLSPLCAGLTEAEVRRVADAGQARTARVGERICGQGEAGDSMFIVLEGRVKVVLTPAAGPEVLLNYLGDGAHFGELSVLVGERRAANVAAVVDTRLLVLHRDDVQPLLLAVPGFTANLCRSLGGWLRQAVTGKRRRSRPAVVALAGAAPEARALVPALAAALAARPGGRPHVLTDRPGPWPARGDYAVESLPPPGDGRVPAFRGQLARALGRHERVLIDLDQKGAGGELPGLLAQCEEIWWLMGPAGWEDSGRRLGDLFLAEPGLAPRTHLVRVQSRAGPRPPPDPAPPGPAAFNVALEADKGGRPAFHPRDLGRLVHHLRRIRVGLALGGGGVRAAAHLGVLRAFERAGICADLIAGTSGGALVGLGYAYGYSAEQMADVFKNVLAPGRLLAALPGGPRWHMWLMYRLGGWRRRAYQHFGHCTFEQLFVPLAVVAADLVSGGCVVRERGSVVEALLESINLPGLARPILRDGQALVDGGVLNNVPGDVLRDRAADLVVGVDVALKLKPAYGPNDAATPAGRMRYPGLMATLLRVMEVQQYGLVSARGGALDLLVAPDTSAFEFTDFARVDRIAELGEAEAEKAVPAVKRLLADLEGE
jgi:predicted acylesterase/phospholipase RssA/CRP-like cAMP-binding protein